MKVGICIVCYNRVDELKRLISSVQSASLPENVDLIFSIDFSDRQNEIKSIVRGVNWAFGDLRVISHSKNLGLKKHILSCGDLSESYDALVILEDDLILSPYFYNYLKLSVNNSLKTQEIAGISLYSYGRNEDNNLPFHPILDSFDNYYLQFASSWGFAVTNAQWARFRHWLALNDVDNFKDSRLPKSINNWGKQSWKKHFIRYLVDTNKYFIYPRFSLTSNPGSDGTHHTAIGELFSVPILLESRCWVISDFSTSKALYTVNFEPVNDVKRFYESYYDNGVSIGTLDSKVSMASYISNNFNITPTVLLKLSQLLAVKFVKKLMKKLGVQ